MNATREEIEIDEVRQALNDTCSGFPTSRKVSSENKDQNDVNQQLLADHKLLEDRLFKLEREFKELKSLPQAEREKLQLKIHELERQLEEAKQSYPFEGYSTEPFLEPVVNEEVHHETEVHHNGHQQSNMQTRRRNNPRKVKHSAAMRTPYETYGVRKETKTKMN